MKDEVELSKLDEELDEIADIKGPDPLERMGWILMALGILVIILALAQ